MDTTMRLVRFADWRTGLLVRLPQGPCLVDVVASLGVFLPEDLITNGLLNGVLKSGDSWASVVQHWELVRDGFRRLAFLASTCPDHPQLVIRRFDDIDISSAPAGFQRMASLEIGEIDEATVKCLRALATERSTAQAAAEGHCGHD